MLFSVIVPIYKVEQYLDECVKSVLGQTFTDFELILVDDGSPDSCPKKCDEWAKIDGRIKVIHKTNGGLSDARNAGIKIASGEYIVFVDGDDYITPNALYDLSKYAGQGADVIAYSGKTEGGNYRLDRASQTGKMQSSQFFLLSLREDKMPMVAWLNAINREFMIKSGLEFKKGIRHEDEEFTPRLFLTANTVINAPVDAYRYVSRDNSITTSKDLTQNARDLYQTLIEHEQRYNELENHELKTLLLDGLVSKYLSLYFQGRLDKRGKEFVKKEFVKRNAKSVRNKKKAKLYCFSPKLYCVINAVSKRLKRIK